MSRDDGFATVDLDVGFLYDPKVRRLAAIAKGRAPTAIVVYVATLTESWREGCRATAVDSWPIYIRHDTRVLEALVASELLDDEYRIPQDAWGGWFGAADARRETARERWRRANEKRTARSPRGDRESRIHPSLSLKRDGDGPPAKERGEAVTHGDKGIFDALRAAFVKEAAG